MRDRLRMKVGDHADSNDAEAEGGMGRGSGSGRHARCVIPTNMDAPGGAMQSEETKKCSERTSDWVENRVTNVEEFGSRAAFSLEKKRGIGRFSGQRRSCLATVLESGSELSERLYAAIRTFRASLRSKQTPVSRLNRGVNPLLQFRANAA